MALLLGLFVVGILPGAAKSPLDIGREIVSYPRLYREISTPGSLSERVHRSGVNCSMKLLTDVQIKRQRRLDLHFSEQRQPQFAPPLEGIRGSDRQRIGKILCSSSQGSMVEGVGVEEILTLSDTASVGCSWSTCTGSTR